MTEFERQKKAHDKAQKHQAELIAALVAAYSISVERVNEIFKESLYSGSSPANVKNLIRRIKAEVRALNAQAVSVSRDIVKSAYQEGASIADIAIEEAQRRVSVRNDLEAQSGVPLSDRGAQGNVARPITILTAPETFLSIPKASSKDMAAAIDAMADTAANYLITANNTLERYMINAVRATQQTVLAEQAVQSSVFRGLQSSSTWQAISEDLKTQFNAVLKEGAKIVINGRKYSPDTYARLVARTMSRDAATMATINRSLQAGITLFQVSAHATSCSQCVPYQGRVYSMVPNEYGFPILDAKPPYHPHCKHILLPFVAQDEAELLAMSEISSGSDIMDDMDARARLEAALRKAS